MPRTSEKEVAQDEPVSNENKKGKDSISVELTKWLTKRIDCLVNDTGDFMSRDNFIEHACFEFMVLRDLAEEQCQPIKMEKQII